MDKAQRNAIATRLDEYEARVIGGSRELAQQRTDIRALLDALDERDARIAKLEGVVQLANNNAMRSPLRIVELETALAFYANDENWPDYIHREASDAGNYFGTPIDDDEGEIARNALRRA